MGASKNWRVRLVDAIRVDASSRPETQAISPIDEMHARRVIELAMRIVRAPVPDHAKLQGLQPLVADI